MSEPILEVRHLVTRIRRRRGGWLTVVDDVSLQAGRGEIVGLVGESGCGKSMTAFSVMQLFPTPAAAVTGGEIIFEDRDLRKLRPDALRQVRGARLGMIFQDPSTFLDPMHTLGDQIAEPLIAHGSAGDPGRRAVDLIGQMGLPDPPLMAKRYPHQVSGGQKQRALIASAMACSPGLLIADEPTTALDVTVQAQILDLMRDLRERTGTAILLITHDLGVVAEMCDRVYVMYAGKVVESNRTRGLFAAPRHPYTQGLLASTVSLETAGGEGAQAAAAIHGIPGTVPGLDSLPPGCRFAPRCPLADGRCQEQPPETAVAGGTVACWHHERAAAANVWLE